MAIWTRPASRAASNSWVMAARVRPLTVVAASGRSSVMRHAVGGPIAVEVLEGDQERAVSFGRGKHSSLERREVLCPFCVGRVEALVDDAGALGRVGGRLGSRSRRPHASRRPRVGLPPDGAIPPARADPTRPGERRGHGLPVLIRRPPAACSHSLTRLSHLS